MLPLLNLHARVPVCGFIAHYNDVAPPPGPDRRPALLATLLAKWVRMQGFVILDHFGPRFDTFRREMGAWLADGRVRLREDVVDGLEQAPQALARILQGGNFGKTVVRVA